MEINETLIEALAQTRIPGEARQCLDAILRKTLGWGKSEDWITLSQFCLMTGLPKQNICRGIARLQKMNVVIIKIDNEKRKTYRINADFSTWKPLSKLITNCRDRKTKPQKALSDKAPAPSVIKIDNKPPLSKLITPIIKNDNAFLLQDRSITITTNSRKRPLSKLIKKNFAENSPEVLLSRRLYNHIKSRCPEYKEPNIQKWAKDMDKILRIDKRNIKTVERIIDWCQQDNFWHKNILSPATLLKHFDQLLIKSAGVKSYYPQNENRPAVPPNKYGTPGEDV